MKTASRSLLFFGVLASVYAIRPASEMLIRHEFQQRSGSRLSMDRCQINMLSGGMLIHGATLAPVEARDGETSIAASPIQIGMIWSKGTLSELLYRRFSAPVTVFDDMRLSINASEIAQVPEAQPVTSTLDDHGLLITSAANPFTEELDQAFQAAQQALGDQRSKFQQLEASLSELEARSLRIDNPLRDRQSLDAAQQRVVDWKRDLASLQPSSAGPRDAFLQTSASLADAMQDADESSDSNKLLGNTDSNQHQQMATHAKRLTEQLVCEALASMKPYLAVSSSLTRQWLIDQHHRMNQIPVRSGPPQLRAARGVDYEFGTMEADEFGFDSIRMRGTLATDRKTIPFSGQMRNVGSQSVDADQRPSLRMSFTSNLPTTDDSPVVSLQSSIVPDRQGFRIQSQMTPTGSMIVSASQHDWRLAAFGQSSSIQVTWVTHQAEWSAEVEILGQECEVVIKRDAGTIALQPSDLEPRYETCFTAPDIVSIAKAKLQGVVVDGVPQQRSMDLESPIVEPLARAMVAQQRHLSEQASKDASQRVRAEFARLQSQRRAEIQQAYLQLASLGQQLQSRLDGFESKLASLANDRDDLRFSREATGAMSR